jgi:hypothetical protein
MVMSDEPFGAAIAETGFGGQRRAVKHPFMRPEFPPDDSSTSMSTQPETLPASLRSRLTGGRFDASMPAAQVG